MKNWLRRIRGAIGMGLTWAAAWSPVGAVIGLVTGVVLGSVPLGLIAGRYAGLFAVLGFSGGAIFSTVLRIAEGNRQFAELSIPRFAAWGALGGVVLGGLASMAGILGAGFTLLGAVIVGGSMLLGAGSAVATLAIARAGDQELLESNTAEVAPRKEARQVLGGTR